MSEVVSNWLVEENLDNPEKCFRSILETFIIVCKMEYAWQNVRNPETMGVLAFPRMPPKLL